LGTGSTDYDETVNIFFYPGESYYWNHIAVISPDDVPDYLTYWGWIGIFSDVGSFGYQINEDPAVYSEKWVHEAEQEVIDSAASMGVEGVRMKIAIPIADLEGLNNTVRVLYKDSFGNAVCLTVFTLVVS
jgi:hypothetical protein